MAKANDLPAGQRGYAKRIPADLLNKLTPEELRLRAREAARIEADADITSDPEGKAGLNALARSYLTAMPIKDYLADKARLTQGALSAPSLDIKYAYNQSLAALNENNRYPHDLLIAAEKRSMGEEVPDSYGVEDIDAIMGLPDSQAEKSAAKSQKARVSKTVQACIDREVAKEVARLKAEEDELRRDIAAFKARQKRDYYHV